MTDQELITLIKTEDDIKAFDALFCRYYPKAVAMASAILHDRDVARDVVQDVFLRIWTGRERLDEKLSLKGLLVTSVRNASINVLKSRHSVIFSALESLPEYAVDSTAADIGLVDTRERIREIVEAMPPVRRRVFRMSREEGKAPDVIAEELGISKRTVDKHIELALKDIRHRLS